MAIKKSKIEVAALSILKDDRCTLLNILKHSRKPVIVSQRWKVYLALSEQGFSAKQIKSYFSVHVAAVYYGIRKLKENDTLRPSEPITATLIQELVNDNENVNDCLICYLLHQKGYGFNTIGRYFGLGATSVRYQLTKHQSKKEKSELEVRRASFYKF